MSQDIRDGMAPVNTEKRCDMHLETASLQLVLFLPVLFELTGALLFPDESQGICTRRIRYVVRSIDRGVAFLRTKKIDRSNIFSQLQGVARRPLQAVLQKQCMGDFLRDEISLDLPEGGKIFSLR